MCWLIKFSLIKFPAFPTFCFFPYEKFARKKINYRFFKLHTLLISFKTLSKTFCSFKTQVSKYCSKLSSKQAYGLSLVLQLLGQKNSDVNLLKSQTHFDQPYGNFVITKRKVLYWYFSSWYNSCEISVICCQFKKLVETDFLLNCLSLNLY